MKTTTEFHIMIKTPDMSDFQYLKQYDKWLTFDSMQAASDHITNVLVKETDVFPQGTVFQIDQDTTYHTVH